MAHLCYVLFKQVFSLLLLSSLLASYVAPMARSLSKMCAKTTFSLPLTLTWLSQYNQLALEYRFLVI